MTTPRLWLLIPAAGSGQRMQSSRPKQYLRLGGELILDLAISSVLDQADLAGCVVALCPNDPLWHETRASKDSRVLICEGGEARAESVLSGLESLNGKANPDDWVLVHDAARPCLHRDDLARLITDLANHDVGGLLASPVTDTLKEATATGSGNVRGTVDRSNLWRALTPQMFRYGLLTSALQASLSNGRPVTDEASAVEQAGYCPCIVEGRPDNIKVTVPADLALADFILSRF